MTRRGSLAYYLAAWICGCVFMTVPVWAYATFGRAFLDSFTFKGAAQNFFLFSFYALYYGLVSSLFASFVLRRLMRALAWRRGIPWVVAGAALAPAVIVTLHFLAKITANSRSPAVDWIAFTALAGPGVVFELGWWLAIPAGGATAYVLYRIDRAFAPESSS